MPVNLRIRVEATAPGKSILPWVATARRGRNTVDSQLFAILGYPDQEINGLTPAALEDARDALELALRMITAFEYIPEHDTDLESFFEKKLLALEERVNLNSAVPVLHGAVGIIHKTNVLFATAGEVLALHITPALITNLSDRSESGNFHFSNFQSGILPARGALLILPKEAGILIKPDELKRLIIDPSTHKLDALDRLWRTRGNPRAPFRGLLLESKAKTIPSSEATATSIAHLLDTEARTEELLSPPLIKPIAGSLKSAATRISRGLRRARVKLSALLEQQLPGHIEETQPQEKITRARRAPAAKPADPQIPASRARAEERAPALNPPSAMLYNTYARVANKIASASRRAAAAYLSPQQWIERFNTFPRKSKTVLIGIAIFFFVFLQSILFTSRLNREEKANTAIGAEIQSLQTALDQINAALIYNDERNARAMLESTRARIDSLPARLKEIAAQFGIRSFGFFAPRRSALPLEEINQSLAEIEQRLRRAIIIDAPRPLETAKTHALGLAPESGRASRFGSRLYELRPEENQILRREKSGDDFDAGSPWIKDGTAVREAVSIAVDGAIYVGMKDGTVIRLLKGRKAEFSLPPIDPPLASMSKLWTDENSDYLYVLDAQEKRLLAFTKKDGLLKAQYLSPAFTALTDFKIDEAAKVAYLLDGEQTISIPLSHF